MNHTPHSECPQLEADRLYLRPLSPDHEELVFQIRSNALIRRYLDRPLMQSRAEAAEFIDWIRKGTAQGKYLYWAILSKTDNSALGTICLWRFNAKRTAADLGYELLIRAQGHGYMREAMAAVLDYARYQLQLEWVHAVTHRDNAPSVSLLRYMGFDRHDESHRLGDNIIYSKPTGGLPAYLERIGLSPNAKPDLNTVQAAHLHSIPFENLDIHLDRPISIRLQDVYRKIVHHRRGGFCYEQNQLFAWVLRALGYEAQLIQAQVYSTEKEAYGPPFDHMAVWVNLSEGPVLADVGFGNASISPIAIKDGATAENEAGRFQIRQLNDHQYLLSQWQDNQWTPNYRFDDTPRRIEDYTVMAHYHQTSPESPFPKKRLITQAHPDGRRVTLTDQELKVTEDGQKQVTPLDQEQTFEKMLLQHFGMSWPPTP